MVGLTADETLEFEVLDQSISDDEAKAEPAVEPLLHWLELYHRHHAAMNKVAPATDSVFASSNSPLLRTMNFDQPARLRFQTAHAARPPEAKFVAMVLAGIIVLFVAGLTLTM